MCLCMSPLEGRMCGLCCRNLLSHVHVALYTLSIGDNCCRNLVLHVCVVLYTLGTGKTYVVQDILQRLCLSAHFTVWRGEPPHASVQEPAGDVFMHESYRRQDVWPVLQEFGVALVGL